jgi:hypothetical protein
MKNFLIVLMLLLAGWQVASAQYEPVVYDYELNYFNNGQPLPAESHLLISGEVDKSIKRVEISLFKAKSNHNHTPLHLSTWKRVKDSEAETFRLPFNYRLNGNDGYDFVVAYFREITDDEQQALKELLHSVISTYLDQQIDFTGEKVKLGKGPAGLVARLDDIVSQAMTHYRSENEIPFNGFSQVVNEGFKFLSSYQEPTKNAVDGAAVGLPLPALRAQVEEQIQTELGQLLDGKLLVQSDLRTLRDYATEKIKNALAVNVGYGGVYLGSTQNTFSYGSGAYVGLSFPFTSRFLSNPLWSNTSLSVGAFLNDFSNADGQEITGPIFGKPYYVGLGYSLFRFVRFNAGMTALEAKGSSTIGGGSIEVGDIKFQPFVGVSAEINLSVGFKERR